MKTTFITIFCVLMAAVIKAQTVSYNSSKPVALKNTTTIDIKHVAATDNVSLPFKVDKISSGEQLTITTSDKDEGTAKLTSDYDYDPALGNISLDYQQGDKTSGTFKVSLTKIQTTKKTNSIFYIEIKNPGNLDKKYKIIVNFNSDDNLVSTTDKADKSFSPDTSKWYVRIVTGGNFDFFNGPTIKDFAGDITAFAPNMFSMHIFGADIPVGMEFGLNNYHYFDSDSSHTGTDNKAYFLSYKDFYNQSDTAKVVKTAQNINKKFDYNVWGVHVDPIFTLSQNEFAQIYLKLHIEELATTETYTPTVGSSVSDTITNAQYSSFIKQNPPTISGYPSVPAAHIRPLISYSQQTFYDIYFGVGLPFAVSFKNVGTLCISPSLGMVSLELSPNSFDETAPIKRDYNSSGITTHETKFYTLNKFQFVTTVAPLNIALGGEYRSVSGNMHYFSSYIGAAVTIDKLKR